jgi:two-component system, sensor histidine kinase
MKNPFRRPPGVPHAIRFRAADTDLNWFTLNFFSRELEAEFRQDYAGKSLWHSRLAIALAAVVWSWLGFLDPWTVPDVLGPVSIVRYGVEVPFLVVLFVFTFSRHFLRFMQPALIIGGLISVVGIIVIEKVMARPAAFHPYFAGLLLIVAGLYTLVRLRFINATCVSWSAVILDNVVSIWLDIPPLVILTNNVFLISANVIGMLAGYNMEVYIRRDFLQRRAAEEHSRAAEEKSRQLELANLAKSRFLAAASHDLRQPLHALGLFVAQLSILVKVGEPRRVVERIDESVASMNELFNALLDVAKLDAGVLTPNRTDFPIAHLFGRVETTFAEAARQKGLQLRIVSCGAWVRSDSILLERILLNLVSNALRYTPRGRVLVGCRRRGDALRIDVCDSGPGIPEDQRRNIFGEFYQLAGAERGRHGGLGLGLAIVDRLCRLLDHPIELTSIVGKGSRFAVLVPCVAAQTKAVAPAPQVTADAILGKLILVIDDDALVREGMHGLLRGWGCNVVTAAAEDAVMAALAKDRPDLIISDYALGNGITGIDVIERLRDRFGAAIPAFLISGDTSPDRLVEVRARGYQLLHKPVPPLALRAMLRRLLKKGTRGATISAPAEAT